MSIQLHKSVMQWVRPIVGLVTIVFGVSQIHCGGPTYYSFGRLERNVRGIPGWELEVTLWRHCNDTVSVKHPWEIFYITRNTGDDSPYSVGIDSLSIYTLDERDSHIDTVHQNTLDGWGPEQFTVSQVDSIVFTHTLPKRLLVRVLLKAVSELSSEPRSFLVDFKMDRHDGGGIEDWMAGP